MVQIPKAVNAPVKLKKICVTPYLACCEPMWFYNSRFKCYQCNRIILNVIGQSNSNKVGAPNE